MESDFNSRERPGWVEPCFLWKLSWALMLVLPTLPWSTDGSPSESKPSDSLRVMSYNIHHAEGIDGELNVKRIADVIRRHDPDIVALQEVDRGTKRVARRDLLAELSEATGFGKAFAKTLDYQGGDYGIGILSRFPILEKEKTFFERVGSGEPRVLLKVAVKMQHHRLWILNTHLDHQATDSELAPIVETIATRAGNHRGNPVILLGDFNQTPSTPSYQMLARHFDDAWRDAQQTDGGDTYPSRNPSKRIDYVFVHKPSPIRVLGACVAQSPASDHLPVIADLRVLWE